MARLLLPQFKAPGAGNQAGSRVRFYTDSGCTSATSVYAPFGVVVPFAVADNSGRVAATLYVDSSVSAVYARTENPGSAVSSAVLVTPFDAEPSSPTTVAGRTVDGGSP